MAQLKAAEGALAAVQQNCGGQQRAAEAKHARVGEAGISQSAELSTWDMALKASS